MKVGLALDGIGVCLRMKGATVTYNAVSASGRVGDDMYEVCDVLVEFSSDDVFEV